ncbi:hypothetical protein Nepgr_004928 [Nepenthes gracilis]|uniref:Uncharacterized protein n=1 Tax=Nepenthes gracilis TaxID=150966 RepID=A0AAD3XFQ2_NEPGR|nr:hypothetical protein Nepgr_004928 [Nepenthes gracilis]
MLLQDCNTPIIYSDNGRNLALHLAKMDRELQILSKSQIDLELAKMRTMTVQEAATAAAQAVEAEAAIAEAESATRRQRRWKLTQKQHKHLLQQQSGHLEDKARLIWQSRLER